MDNLIFVMSVNRLKTEIKKLKKENEDIKGQLNPYSNINEQLILTVSELRNENKKYHDREIVYTHKIMALDKTVKDLQRKITTLEFLLDEIFS